MCRRRAFYIHLSIVNEVLTATATMDEFGRLPGAAEISAEEMKAAVRIATLKNDMQKKLEEASEACDRNGAARLASLQKEMQKKLEEATVVCNTNGAARVATLQREMQGKLDKMKTHLEKKVFWSTFIVFELTANPIRMSSRVTLRTIGC